MTITGGSALPKDEIERMMRDAESHAEEDRRRREEAETRNQAEALVYQTERFLADNEDAVAKVPAETKTEVDEALAETKKSLEGADYAAIRAGADRLQRASTALGTAIYAAAAPADAAAGGDGQFGDGQGSAATGEDEVVDAEIVDEEQR